MDDYILVQIEDDCWQIYGDYEYVDLEELLEELVDSYGFDE